MRFAEPSLLGLLALLPLLGLLVWVALARRRRRLRAFASQNLLPRLLVGASPVRTIVLSTLRIAGIAFCVVALARPQWGRKDEPVVRRGVDVVLALDLSTSMLAEDVSPSRLEEAKAEAASLLKSLSGDRVAFVVFGGRAAVQCPLTLDYGAVRLFLDAAEVFSSPGPGSDVGRAIEESLKLFNSTEKRYKTMVLLTDGEDLEGKGLEAAKKAAEEGVIIHAIGVGTLGGGPIPLRDEGGAITGYKKDREGRVVTTRLDPGELEAIAAATGGTFLTAGPVGDEGRRIAVAIGGMDKKETASRLATTFEDHYQLPLAIGLVFLAIEAAWIGRRKRAGAGAGEAAGRDVPVAGTNGRTGTGAGSEARDTAPAAAAALRKAGAAALCAILSVAAIRPPARAADGTAPAEGSGSSVPASGAAGGTGSAGPVTGPGRPKGSGGGGQGAGAKRAVPDKAPTAAVAKDNREGNRLYEKKDYGEALSRYEQASAAAPGVPSLRYNIGNALYRQGKYEEAASEYTHSLAKEGAAVAPAARYNLGNTQYQQKHYEEAADAYLKVLQDNPSDEDARRNLELALRALKQAKQQSQQSQQDKKDKDSKQQQSQQQQASKNGKQDKKDSQDQSQQDQQQKQDEQKDQGSQDQQQNPDQQKGARAQPKDAEGKMSKKDAERLLDSLAQEEKRDLKQRLARMPREEGPEKDW